MVRFSPRFDHPGPRPRTCCVDVPNCCCIIIVIVVVVCATVVQVCKRSRLAAAEDGAAAASPSAAAELQPIVMRRVATCDMRTNLGSRPVQAALLVRFFGSLFFFH